MARLIQPSFSKGEISPSLYGRVDTAAYQVALRKAKNVVIHPYGGASNRPGTTYLGPVKTHTIAPRLIPFQFKTTDQYILEFGNLYMRVIRNDAHVLNTATNIDNITQGNPAVVTSTSHGLSDGDEVYITGVSGMLEVNGNRYLVANKTTNTFELTSQFDSTNIDSSSFTAYTSGGTVASVYEITTTYATADLLNIKYSQQADLIILTHPSYHPAKLTRTDHDAWTLADITFTPGVDHPTGASVTAGSSGSTTYKYKITSIEVDTFEESLSALDSTTATITAITQADPAVVTSASHHFLDGDQIEINSVVGMTELNGIRFTVANKATNTFELKGEDSTNHTAYSSAGSANRTFVEETSGHASTPANALAWTDDPNAERYSIYKEENGIYGYIADSTTNSYTDPDDITPDVTLVPPIFKNPFRAAVDYPATSAFFEQRSVWGGSTNKPDTTYYSKTGDIFNMSVSFPTRDDDSITATLSSQDVNEIRHFVPLNDLLTFTSGSEWRINSGPDSAFTLSSVKQKPQSFWGSSHLKPIVSGNTVLYVEESNSELRNIGYSFQIDGYTGSKLNLLSTHIFGIDSNHTAVDWSYQHSPESRIVITLNDGDVATMTFDPEQEVIAWTHWETDGDFERTTQLRHSSDNIEDDIYFVVKRIVDGNTVRYIEKLGTRVFDDIRDAYFVDSGLTYDVPLTITGSTAASPVVITSAAHGLVDNDLVDITGIKWVSDMDSSFTETQPRQINDKRFKVKNATTNTFELTDPVDGSDIDGSSYNAYVEDGEARKAVTTFLGLEHLEGESIVANADGNYVTDLTVSGGQVTLTEAASRVHLGLRYVADIQTLDVTAPSNGGTIQGLYKKIPTVVVRFEKTRGMLFGPDEDNLEELKQREFDLMGDPTAMLTGDKEVNPSPDWNTNGRIFIRQPFPLPMTILAIIPEVVVGDEDVE